MSVYVGIDVHRKRSQVAVIDQDGQVLANRNVNNGVQPILSVIGGLPPGTQAAFEAAFGWGWPAGLLEDYGFEPHLVHPLQCKAIASARLKTRSTRQSWRSCCARTCCRRRGSRRRRCASCGRCCGTGRSWYGCGRCCRTGIRNALIELFLTAGRTSRMFGARDAVDPVRHLIGAAGGWGAHTQARGVLSQRRSGPAGRWPGNGPSAVGDVWLARVGSDWQVGYPAWRARRIRQTLGRPTGITKGPARPPSPALPDDPPGPLEI